jgi:rubrerythrin
VNETSAVGSEARLIALLRLAYSGERAAAHAYRGHARSVRDPAERARILQIEQEEWRHRREVGAMLQALGAPPSRAREARALLIGRCLGALCHVAGRLLPMVGAGRLESRNIREYETAARHARDAGRGGWVPCLLDMAELEWEHELYFRQIVLAHPLGRRLPLWQAPPPKASIRGRYAAESREAAGRGALRSGGDLIADAPGRIVDATHRSTACPSP